MSFIISGDTHGTLDIGKIIKFFEENEGNFNEDFFNRRSGVEVLRAYNVGCMMPYMDYEPKSLAEIARGAESINRLN